MKNGKNALLLSQGADMFWSDLDLRNIDFIFFVKTKLSARNVHHDIIAEQDVGEPSPGHTGVKTFLFIATIYPSVKISDAIFISIKINQMCTQLRHLHITGADDERWDYCSK
jgi:hypothetical protein